MCMCVYTYICNFHVPLLASVGCRLSLVSLTCSIITSITVSIFPWLFFNYVHLCLCPNIFLFIRTPFITDLSLNIIQYNFILTWLHTQEPHFQISSNLQLLEDMNFWGDNIQPSTVISQSPLGSQYNLTKHMELWYCIIY